MEVLEHEDQRLRREPSIARAHLAEHAFGRQDLLVQE